MSADNLLRGTSESRMGTIKMTGGTYDPATKAIQWKIKNEFMGTVTYKGKLDGETITGTLANEDGEFTMNFNMKRTSKDVPPPADDKPATADKPATDKPAGNQPAAGSN